MFKTIIKRFSVQEAVIFGFRGAISNFLLVVFASFLMFLLSQASAYAQKGMERSWPLAVLIGLGSFVLSQILQMGVIKTTIKIAKKEKPRVDDLFSEVKLFWKYLGATVLYTLIVVGGLILLVIPGIIWALDYQFYRYLLVEKKMGIIEALKKSKEIARDQRINLLGLLVTYLCIIIVGAILLMPGVFFALAIILIANASVYEKLMHPKPVEEPKIEPVVSI